MTYVVALLVLARTAFPVFALVGLLALGTALIPQRSQQPGAGERTAVGERVVHVADERSVFADRSRVTRGRSANRVASDGQATRSQTRVIPKMSHKETR